MRSVICAYPVQRPLNADRTYLASSPSGPLVLKRLPPDALLNSQLHPEIRDRLNRIREISTTRIAQFIGIERDDDAWLVWQYVEGTPLDELPPPRRESLKGETRLAIAALHTQGIVHGAIRGRNIIVAEDGTLRLTHASPLLYHDPATDWAAFDQLFPADATTEQTPVASPPIDPVRRRAWMGFAVVMALAISSVAVIYHFTRPASVPTLTP